MRDEQNSSKTVAPENRMVHTDKLLLTIDEVAEMTGLSVGTLYHWVSQERIPVVRFSSRCVRFRLKDIEDWIAGQVVAERDQGLSLPIGRTDKSKCRKTKSEAA